MGKKWFKMRKNYVMLHISWIIYIWFWFMVLMWKMIISPGCFFIFSKFWFSGLLEGKRAKNSPKWQKIMSVTLDISGTIHHMISYIISPGIFLIFFKILILWVLRRVKVQRMTENDKKLCPLHFIIHLMILIYGTNV